MPSPGLRIFVAHRIDYADRMYQRLVQMVDDAVSTGLLQGWTDLSLKPFREYRDRRGRQLDDAGIWRLAQERIRDSSLVLVADRPATDRGDWLKDEIAVAVRFQRPILGVYDPYVGRSSSVLPWDSGLVYPSYWRYDSLARAIAQACDEWDTW